MQENNQNQNLTPSYPARDGKLGWMHKGWHVPHHDGLTIGLAIFIGAVLVIATIVGLKYVNNGDQPQKVKNVVNLDKVYSTALPIKTSMYDLLITKAYQSTKPVTDIKAEPGKTYVGFTLSIKNISGKEQKFNPTTMLFVHDRDGNIYLPAKINFEDGLRTDSLPNGQTISGQIAFLVPDKLVKPILYVDVGWNQVQPVVVSVLE